MGLPSGKAHPFLLDSDAEFGHGLVLCMEQPAQAIDFIMPFS
jgi:hypothetical protein